MNDHTRMLHDRESGPPVSMPQLPWWLASFTVRAMGGHWECTVERWNHQTDTMDPFTAQTTGSWIEALRVAINLAKDAS